MTLILRRTTFARTYPRKRARFRPRGRSKRVEFAQRIEFDPQPVFEILAIFGQGQVRLSETERFERAGDEVFEFCRGLAALVSEGVESGQSESKKCGIEVVFDSRFVHYFEHRFARHLKKSVILIAAGDHQAALAGRQLIIAETKGRSGEFELRFGAFAALGDSGQSALPRRIEGDKTVVVFVVDRFETKTVQTHNIHKTSLRSPLFQPLVKQVVTYLPRGAEQPLQNLFGIACFVTHIYVVNKTRANYTICSSCRSRGRRAPCPNRANRA